MEALSPDWLRQLTLEPTLLPPEVPPAWPSDNEASHAGKIEGKPPGYVYIHTPHASGKLLNLDAYAKDSKCEKESIHNMLTDDRISTG